MGENYREIELRRATERTRAMDEEIIPRLRAAGFGNVPLHEIDGRGRMLLHMLARIPRQDGTPDDLLVVPVFLKGASELDLVACDRQKSRFHPICYYTDGSSHFCDQGDQKDIFPLIDWDDLRFADVFARHLLGADPDDGPSSYLHPLDRIDKALGGPGLAARCNATDTIERRGVVWDHPRRREVMGLFQAALGSQYAHVEGRIVDRCQEPRWVVICDDTSTIRKSVRCWSGRSTAAQPLSVSFPLSRSDLVSVFVAKLRGLVPGGRTSEADAETLDTSSMVHDGRTANVSQQAALLPKLIQHLGMILPSDLENKVATFSRLRGSEPPELEGWVDDWLHISSLLKKEIGKIESGSRKVSRWLLRTNLTIAALDVLADMDDDASLAGDRGDPTDDEEVGRDETPTGLYRKVEIRRVHRLAVVLDGDVDDILTAVREWSTDRPVRVGLTILDHVQEGRTWPRVRLKFETAVTSLPWRDLKAQVLDFVSGLAVVEGTSGFALHRGDHVEVYARATTDERKVSLAGTVLPVEVL